VAFAAAPEVPGHVVSQRQAPSNDAFALPPVFVRFGWHLVQGQEHVDDVVV
jgi:hypothetical protein